MISKTLLLLALMCGSATAANISNTSKNEIDDIAKIAAKVDNDVRDYAMGDDAGIEMVDHRVAFNKRETIKFSYDSIKSDAFRLVESGCKVDMSIDSKEKVITADVDFTNNEGHFEIKADNGKTTSVYFVKDGDQVVASTVSLDDAKRNFNSVNNTVLTSDFDNILDESIHAKEIIEEAKRLKLDLSDIGITSRLRGVNATFNYIDDYGMTIPLRGIKVEVCTKDDSGNETIIKSGYTSNDGKFIYLTLLRAGSPLIANGFYVRLTSEAMGINIVDESGAQYVWQSNTLLFGSTITQVTQTFSTSETLGKGFAITQPAVMAANYAKFINNGEYITTATLHYPYGTDGSWYSGNNIYISGKTVSPSYINSRPQSYACFDVVGHEYGHHVQRTFGITKNPGGTHYSKHNAEDDFHDQKNSSGTNMYSEQTARDRGIKLAYAEGWATAYSLMAQKHFADLYDGIKFACDDRYTSYNGVNVGYGNYEVCKGEGAEESVTSFIWNLFDDDNTYDPFDTVCYPEDLLMSFSHGAFTLSDFVVNLEDCDPDQDAVGAIMAKLNITTSYVTVDGELYTNAAPTFVWNCSGGSKYYTNNKFLFYIESSNYRSFFSTEVRVSGTPSTARYTLPLNIWKTIIESGADSFNVYIDAFCDRNNIETGGYKSQNFTFDMPTAVKPMPTDVEFKVADWGFAQKYDGTVITANYTKENVNFTTKRLRTGTIEKDQVVMSAKKKGAGSAYFEITTDVAMDSVSFDMSMWSASEGITASNSTIKVEVLDGNGNWNLDTDCWHDITLSTSRTNMGTYSTQNSYAIYGVRFAVTAPATGSSNAGRVALRDIVFHI